MTDTLLDTLLYDVLNPLALKKMATAQSIAEVAGLPLAEVTGALERLGELDLVVTIGDQSLPTDNAVPALWSTAAERYAALRADPAVLDMAARFEAVNASFLTTISSWQQVEVGGRRITNDHQDTEYDSKVLGRVEKLVARLVHLIAVLSERDPRFARYAARFTEADALVAAGDLDFVSSPTRESIHNIWFEFHEDLLRTLGRVRSE
jgi:hypothetical protein